MSITDPAGRDITATDWQDITTITMPTRLARRIETALTRLSTGFPAAYHGPFPELRDALTASAAQPGEAARLADTVTAFLAALSGDIHDRLDGETGDRQSWLEDTVQLIDHVLGTDHAPPGTDFATGPATRLAGEFPPLRAVPDPT